MVVLSILLLISGSIYYYILNYRKHPSPSKSSIESVYSPTLLPVQSITPSSHIQPNPTVLFTKDNPIKGWKTFKVREYQFQLSYPEEGWLFSEGSFYGEPIIPSSQLKFTANLYSQRVTGQLPYRNTESVVFIFTVYENATATSLSQWLFDAIPDLPKAEKGNIHNALIRASAGERGIVSYSQSEKEDIQASEFGAVILNGGVLSYSAYITGSGLKYIYAIELLLPYYERLAKPPDSTYEELFKQIVSTFKFIE
jgi:hypothetical protein